MLSMQRRPLHCVLERASILLTVACALQGARSPTGRGHQTSQCGAKADVGDFGITLRTGLAIRIVAQHACYALMAQRFTWRGTVHIIKSFL